MTGNDQKIEIITPKIHIKGFDSPHIILNGLYYEFQKERMQEAINELMKEMLKWTP